ncbi:MAG: hypothetical protein E6J34_00560 [Chloroflexi bacterium]|nr:MAG: hypothetical protein E6J34_00560 [Chloroflexota bacterium]
MEKRPTDRYAHAQDLASAFRMALVVAGVVLEETQQGLATLRNPTNEQAFMPRGLFEAGRSLRTAKQPMINAGQQTNQANVDNPPRADIVAKTRMTLPSLTDMLPPPSTPTMAEVVPPSPTPPQHAPSTANTLLPPTGLLLGKTGSPRTRENTTGEPAPAPALDNKFILGSSLLGGASRLLPPLPQAPTRTNNNEAPTRTNNNPAIVPIEDGQGTTSMVRLTQSMKIVKVPVAGQPGRYLTGLLPATPPTPQPSPSTEPRFDPQSYQDIPHKGSVKTIVVLVLVLLVVFGSGIFLLVSSHNRQSPSGNTVNTAMTPATVSKQAAQASATASANIIVADPLTSNDHNWKVSNNGPQQFLFKDGAYHISNNDTHAATALLPDEALPSPFVYTLALNEIKGDDTSVNNQFGLVIRYSDRKKDGRLASTFYLFDIASAKLGGEYQFWKYDDSFGADVNPWTKLWNKPYGKEYHFGHGQNQTNTFKVMVQGNKYSFVVNDQSLGSTSDNSLNGGQIGMLVNLKGTEVAFSNLLLTYQ